MKKLFVSSFLLFFLALSITASPVNSLRHAFYDENLPDSVFAQRYAKQVRLRLDTMWQRINVRDTSEVLNQLIDPAFDKLYLPVTYYQAVSQRYHFKFEATELFPDTTKRTSWLEYNVSLFRRYEATREFMDRCFFELYKHHPEAIEKWDYKIDALKIYNVDRGRLEKSKSSIMDIFTPEVVPEAKIRPWSVKLVRPHLWKLSGTGSIQFSQNHISDNWYKGGESNANLLANLTLNANYSDRNSIQFDNSFEVKLGFNTSPSDTLHEYRVNTDLFRLTSKLGVKARENWYYTVSTQFYSQFFSNYATNSNVRNSAFLTPGYLSVGLGMDYKKNTNKVTLSVLMNPIAYNLRFVTDKNIDETRFGIKEGQFLLQTYGSELTTNFTWKITSYITYTSRLYGFTNYERSEGSWENTINLVLNKYFSTQFFSHVRFDDNVTKTSKNDTYFQYKEIFSFGISYAW